MDYYDIEDLLLEVGDFYCCEQLAVDCYSYLIERLFGYEPVNCYGLTINEFAEKHPHGKYLMRIEGHLSILVDKNIYDIWDCRDQELTHAWRVD
jgi:hypothetical protein